ncbi:metallophosphoesterase [Limosilactobacillus sp.]|uniref:metallophosphoesterase n=1 Tax=Limosilactobacillus sp. TaxID=2773925 RepID=UPI003DAA0023
MTLITKIAISSDNHLDINKVDTEAVLKFQSSWLNQNKVDYYLYGGDLFNDFQKTEQYFSHLQSLVSNTKIYYIIGNHDMLNNVSFSQVENPHHSLYIHNRFVDIPNSDWRIIGNNGWYDYSFSCYHNDPAQVRQWKNVFWLDGSIEQPLSDQERMNLVLTQVKHQLLLAKQANKQVLFLTHFAPRHELLSARPKEVDTPRKERFYQMINAMMGSDQLRSILENSGIVKEVFYGHLHGIHPPLTRAGVAYYHQAVGVNNRRINEWQKNNFFEQWVATARVIDLDT